MIFVYPNGREPAVWVVIKEKDGVTTVRVFSDEPPQEIEGEVLHVGVDVFDYDEQN